MLSADPLVQRYRPSGARGAGALMAARKRRGPGPSHVLITPDHAGNVVGIDPHKRTLTAVVVDARGGVLAGEHFRVSGDGHRALCGLGAPVRADRALGSGERQRLGPAHRDLSGWPRAGRA